MVVGTVSKTQGKAIRFLGAALLFLLVVAAGKTVTVLKEAKGRAGPGAYYKLVTLIPEGARLEVLEKKKRWLKVKFGDKEVWISESSNTREKKEENQKDVFGSLSLDKVSAEASPAVLSAAIKGFWTRYSRNAGKTFELPLEWECVSSESYERFAGERARAVDRGMLFRKYRLKSRRKERGVPYEREHKVGYACASAVAAAPPITSETLVRYIHHVGWYVAEGTECYDMRFTYYVLDTDRINAVSCPGGYVVLTRGLLELLGDESELAALLAHEMAHVIAGHGMLEMMRNKVRITADSAFESLNRQVGSTELENELVAITDRARAIAESPKLDKYEFEADEMALRYLARSGYDLDGIVRLLEKLKAEHDAHTDMFDLNYRNHPDFGERMKRLGKEMKKYGKYSGKRFEGSFRENLVF